MRLRGRHFVAPVSFGLGDLVVSLPVVQASIGGERATWLVARSESQAALAERITGLAGVVHEGEPAMGPGDELLDLRDHPLQRDHWWGSAAFESAYGPLSINEIVARIAADAGVHADFSSPHPLHAVARPDASGSVVLVADADGSAKRWPWERWLRLAEGLGDRGERVAVITRGVESHPLVVAGLSEIVADTPGAAVDVLTSCRAVVGVDTGLTHIAAQQRTPTVTLSRRPAVYFRAAWPHTALVCGAPCGNECRQSERAYAYHDRISLADHHPPPRTCPLGSPCVAGIDPAAVLDALGALL